ncbi:MAG TPA: 50S ribosomal protein L22 [Desulfobulbaceae bacterium]|nr:50S ribosomal protein L22 [Desulfobulbaceae bacterium]
MDIKAVAKYIRVSPQKARLVADMVRGKSVSEAVNILRYTNKKSAPILRKVLDSALANAMQYDGTDVDALFVREIQVNGGPVLKRISPRAQGRATGIIKRSSHITIVLDERF